MAKLNPENQLDRIIALWQTEDLLRAHQFDIERLLNSRKFESEEDYQHSLEWLSEFKGKMQKEEVLEVGHTSDSHSLIEPLQRNHHAQMEQSESYKEQFNQIAPAIRRYNLQKQLPASEVITMLELLYAFFLKRLANEPMGNDLENLGVQSGEILNHLTNV